MSARDKRIVRRSRISAARDRTDWKRLKALTDREIQRAVAEDPDAAPLLDADWFKSARHVSPPEKGRITIRLDKDILSFFRTLGPRYQTRINTVLRAYVEHVQRARK